MTRRRRQRPPMPRAVILLVVLVAALAGATVWLSMSARPVPQSTIEQEVAPDAAR